MELKWSKALWLMAIIATSASTSITDEMVTGEAAFAEPPVDDERLSHPTTNNNGSQGNNNKEAGARIPPPESGETMSDDATRVDNEGAASRTTNSQGTTVDEGVQTAEDTPGKDQNESFTPDVSSEEALDDETMPMDLDVEEVVDERSSSEQVGGSVDKDEDGLGKRQDSGHTSSVDDMSIPESDPNATDVEEPDSGETDASIPGVESLREATGENLAQDSIEGSDTTGSEESDSSPETNSPEGSSTTTHKDLAEKQSENDPVGSHGSSQESTEEIQEPPAYQEELSIDKSNTSGDVPGSNAVHATKDTDGNEVPGSDSTSNSDVVAETLETADESSQEAVNASETQPSKQEKEAAPEGSLASFFEKVDKKNGAKNGSGADADHGPSSAFEQMAKNAEVENVIEQKVESEYSGAWGVFENRKRLPDMELLYQVFEDRVRNVLGIRAEATLKEHLFPLPIGTDDEEPLETAIKEGKTMSTPTMGDFTDGIDDIDKLFEGVDPPDELDVGASGSSMQEVLVKKGAQILVKRVKMGFHFVKRIVASTKQKLVTRFTDEDGNFVLTMEDVRNAASGIWHASESMYSRVVDFVDNLLDNDGPEDDNEGRIDIDSVRSMGLSSDPTLAARLAQQRGNKDEADDMPTPTS